MALFFNGLLLALLASSAYSAPLSSNGTSSENTGETTGPTETEAPQKGVNTFAGNTANRQNFPVFPINPDGSVSQNSNNPPQQGGPNGQRPPFGGQQQQHAPIPNSQPIGHVQNIPFPASGPQQGGLPNFANNVHTQPHPFVVPAPKSDGEDGENGTAAATGNASKPVQPQANNFNSFGAPQQTNIFPPIANGPLSGTNNGIQPIPPVQPGQQAPLGASPWSNNNGFPQTATGQLAVGSPGSGAPGTQTGGSGSFPPVAAPNPFAPVNTFPGTIQRTGVVQVHASTPSSAAPEDGKEVEPTTKSTTGNETGVAPIQPQPFQQEPHQGGSQLQVHINQLPPPHQSVGDAVQQQGIGGQPQQFHPQGFGGAPKSAPSTFNVPNSGAAPNLSQISGAAPNSGSPNFGAINSGAPNGAVPNFGVPTASSTSENVAPFGQPQLASGHLSPVFQSPLARPVVTGEPVKGTEGPTKSPWSIVDKSETAPPAKDEPEGKPTATEAELVTPSGARKPKHGAAVPTSKTSKEVIFAAVNKDGAISTTAAAVSSQGSNSGNSGESPKVSTTKSNGGGDDGQIGYKSTDESNQ